MIYTHYNNAAPPRILSRRGHKPDRRMCWFIADRGRNRLRRRGMHCCGGFTRHQKTSAGSCPWPNQNVRYKDSIRRSRKRGGGSLGAPAQSSTYEVESLGSHEREPPHRPQHKRNWFNNSRSRRRNRHTHTSFPHWHHPPRGSDLASSASGLASDICAASKVSLAAPSGECWW